MRVYVILTLEMGENYRSGLPPNTQTYISSFAALT